MSWILQNKFLAALISGTVVVSGLLLYFGSKASGRYQDLLEEFQQASAQVATYERLAIYPSQENLDGKAKALSAYEQAIDDLKKAFVKFQAGEAERITPQEFGNRLIAGNERIKTQFRTANVTVPSDFYSGFELYTGTLAQSGAANVLDQQLAIVESIMADLAKAKPAEINNFLRENQPEEAGRAYEPGEDDIVRPFSFELTFHGTEASARKFITSLVDTSKRLVVIRSIRILNESTVAPKSSSAQFAAAAPAAVPAAEAFFGDFANIFNLADDDADAEGDADAEADDEPEEVAPQPAPQPSSTGTRMLGQVAGNEMVRVFIRFDVMEILPQALPPQSDES